MLLIFALLVIAGSVHASVIDCDQVPPAFWCLNQTLIEECEWNVPCSKYLAKSKGQKIPVTVMYLTQCPACRRYISGELQEVYSNHGDKLDIELAPVGGDHKYPKEVNGSKYDACLIKYVKEPVRFIGCVEQRIDQGPEAAGQECFKQFQTDAATIDHVNRCYKGAEGEELAKAYVARIYSAHPTRPHVVPWFVISNVSLKAIQGYRNDLGFAAKHFYVPNDVSKKIFLTEDKLVNNNNVCHLEL